MNFSIFASFFASLFAAFLPHHSTFGAGVSTIPTTNVNCVAAFQGPKYDTPSGHIQKGYWDMAFPGPSPFDPGIDVTTLTKATKVGGNISWKRCYDSSKTRYEINVPDSEFSTYLLPGAYVPSGTIQATTTSSITVN